MTFDPSSVNIPLPVVIAVLGAIISFVVAFIIAPLGKAYLDNLWAENRRMLARVDKLEKQQEQNASVEDLKELRRECTVTKDDLLDRLRDHKSDEQGRLARLEEAVFSGR